MPEKAMPLARWAPLLVFLVLTSVYSSVLAGEQLEQLDGVDGRFPLADDDEGRRPSPPPLTATEALLVSAITNGSSQESLFALTRVPPVAGTPAGAAHAELVAGRLRGAGLPSVELFSHRALLSYAVNASLVLLAQDKPPWVANLAEDVIPEDIDSGRTPLRTTPFLAYAPSGAVSATAVYANYGRPEDFESLEEAGVSVSGRIALVRYGRCFRGLKVMNAQRRGAVGVIIYSDPADDGFGRGDVYPVGTWRPESSVQRGSASFLSLCAGDPGRVDTPGGTAAACGYAQEDILPRIPALPLSYRNALPLLSAMGGPAAPSNFIGGLAVDYRLGPGPMLHLTVNNVLETRPLHNVIAVIPGRLDPSDDRPVLLGNHHDAWVYGAADPASGTAAMIEVAKGLGALYRTGWRPLRSIYLLSWDGEEPGLIGSTAWAQANAGRALASAIAYLNVDEAMTCNANSPCSQQALLYGSPTLAGALREALGDARVPSTGERLRQFGDVHPLGSGSDFTAFVDNLGIASTQFTIGRGYGVYHSVYDSYTWAQKADPGSNLIAAAAQVWALLAVRLACDPIPAFDHAAMGDALGDYLESLAKWAPPAGTLDRLERAIDDYVAAAADVAKQVMRAAAMGQDDEDDAADVPGINWPPAPLPPPIARLADRVALAERRFLLPDGVGLPGLPGSGPRAFFRNAVYAPDIYLGYKAATFPGVAAALAAGNWTLAAEQAELAGAAVAAAAAYLRHGDDPDRGRHFWALAVASIVLAGAVVFLLAMYCKGVVRAVAVCFGGGGDPGQGGGDSAGLQEPLIPGDTPVRGPYYLSNAAAAAQASSRVDLPAPAATDGSRGVMSPRGASTPKRTSSFQRLAQFSRSGSIVAEADHVV